jgi:hypothetical protein
MIEMESDVPLRSELGGEIRLSMGQLCHNVGKNLKLPFKLGGARFCPDLRISRLD